MGYEEAGKSGDNSGRETGGMKEVADGGNQGGILPDGSLEVGRGVTLPHPNG